MKINRVVYFCSYSKNYDEIAVYLKPCNTLQEAQKLAQKMKEKGYCGTIEKVNETKQDYENDFGWNVNWDEFGKNAVKLVEYF